MKKLDILTPVGLLGAIGMVFFGIISAGASMASFIDVASIVITLGGSLFAVLATFPLSDISGIPKALQLAMFETNLNKVDLVGQFKDIAKKVRTEGVLSLEASMAEIENDFLRQGLGYVVDGMDPELTKSIMETEIAMMEMRYGISAKIFKLWGSFCPAFGMVGTLIGLVNMMGDVSDANKVAMGMAAALLTTFYGSLLANGIFNPIGYNIDIKAEKEAVLMEMIMAGVISIQREDSMPTLEASLICFLDDKDKKTFEDGGGA